MQTTPSINALFAERKANLIPKNFVYVGTFGLQILLTKSWTTLTAIGLSLTPIPDTSYKATKGRHHCWRRQGIRLDRRSEGKVQRQSIPQHWRSHSTTMSTSSRIIHPDKVMSILRLEKSDRSLIIYVHILRWFFVLSPVETALARLEKWDVLTSKIYPE